MKESRFTKSWYFGKLRAHEHSEKFTELVAPHPKGCRLNI